MTPELERTGRRLGLVVVAVALVVSMALSGYAPGEGPIEEAAAVHNCDKTDALVYGFSFGHVNKDRCTNNHVGDAVERVREAESQQSKVDLYSAASAQSSRTETFAATYDNYLNDSESIAWMKAEKAIAEAYENGSTKSQAKTEARQAISDYYAVKQINLINSWNTTVLAYEYLVERSLQEGFDQNDFGNLDPDHKDPSFIGFHAATGGSGHCEINDRSSTPISLVNSTNHDTKQLGIRFSGDSSWEPWNPTISGELYNDEIKCGTNSYRIQELIVNPPNNNYDEAAYYDAGDTVQKWQTIEQKNSELQSETDAFVDAIWQDLQDGNINSSDVISRNTQMFEYGTAAQNSSNYYDTIGATAAMGIETPQLEGTGTMTITDGGGNTHEGMLFGDPPNGSWTVGTTYDPSNISGPVIMATTDGEELELDRPFTVESATDKDGNEQSVVETQRYNYQTSNTSDLNEKYNRLLGLSDDLQQRSESVDSNNGGGGGGGSSGGGTIPDWLTATYFGIPLWAIAAVLLVALVLIGGDN